MKESSTSGPPSRPPTPEVLAALKELQAEYALVLPSLVKKLEDALRAARERPEDPRSLEDVRGQAHKLRGSAGSYGFPEVGDSAARIEEAAVSMQNALTPAGAETWAGLDRAMREMAAAADRAVKSVTR
jgi:HPt (histidine-containing phosphotransfer) domain-containing protein